MRWSPTWAHSRTDRREGGSANSKGRVRVLCRNPGRLSFPSGQPDEKHIRGVAEFNDRAGRRRPGVIMTTTAFYRTRIIPALALFCIVTLAISSAGCTATAADPIRIGVLLPADGPVALHSLEGLAWAADAMNRQGGRTIELVCRDTSTGNISAYAEGFAGRNDIAIVIGPAMSAELIDIAPSSRVGQTHIPERHDGAATEISTITVFSGGPPLPTAGRWRPSSCASAGMVSGTSRSSRELRPTGRRLHGLPRRRPRRTASG